MTDAKAKKLCTALEKNTHALSLDLSNNDLGNAGVKAICAVLAAGAAPDLIELRLLDNPIGEEGLEAVKELEKARKTLRIETGSTPPVVPIPVPPSAPKGPSPITSSPNGAGEGSGENKSLADSAIVRKYFQVGNDDGEVEDEEVATGEGVESEAGGGMDPEQLSALLWDKVR